MCFRPLTGNGIFNHPEDNPFISPMQAAGFRPLTGNGIFNDETEEDLEYAKSSFRPLTGNGIFNMEV